ncbi:MAG: hypothetical protein LBL66_01550 [Clostridiales bacterium]|jgi:hypothetical protein|nr:hypothetical protein [Clostridiales bacterium]
MRKKKTGKLIGLKILLILCALCLSSAFNACRAPDKVSDNPSVIFPVLTPPGRIPDDGTVDPNNPDGGGETPNPDGTANPNNPNGSETPDPDGGGTETPRGQGTGTADDPFRIYNADDLDALRKRENFAANSDTTNHHFYYALQNDVELPGPTDGELSNFTPIEKFYGTLDGGGFAVRNLCIDKTLVLGGDASGDRPAAFILAVERNAEVKNLTVEIGSVAGSAAAAIACENRGKITACTVSPYTSPSAVSGGILGLGASGTCGGIAAKNYGEISDCVNYAPITAPEPIACAGGIAGDTNDIGDDYGAGKILRCVNKGAIECNAAHVGGITGTAGPGAVISRCVNLGTVTDTGSDYVGGIAGFDVTGMFGSATPNAGIIECVSAGNLIAEARPNVGAIVGGTDGPPLSGFSRVVDCYTVSDAEGLETVLRAIGMWDMPAFIIVWQNNTFLI